MMSEKSAASCDRRDTSAASGAGSASRITIGVVVVFGVAFSTLLSLLVVPVFYGALARFTSSPDAVGQELERLEDAHPQAEAAH